MEESEKYKENGRLCERCPLKCEIYYCGKSIDEAELARILKRYEERLEKFMRAIQDFANVFNKD